MPLSIKLIVLLVVALQATAVFSQRGIIHLACSVDWTTGRSAPQTLDFAVDLNDNTVSGVPARISNESITFDDTLKDGFVVKTRINRLSGAISMDLGRGANLVGICSPVTTRRF
jgi:hypothetical protein